MHMGRVVLNSLASNDSTNHTDIVFCDCVCMGLYVSTDRIVFFATKIHCRFRDGFTQLRRTSPLHIVAKNTILSVETYNLSVGRGPDPRARKPALELAAAS